MFSLLLIFKLEFAMSELLLNCPDKTRRPNLLFLPQPTFFVKHLKQLAYTTDAHWTS